MANKVDVLAVLGSLNLANPDQRPALNATREAVAQFQRDVQASLSMLAADGFEDAPVAGFLRAALARVGGSR